MRRIRLALATLVFTTNLIGCAGLSSHLATNWSENYALATFGTKGNHVALNDGKVSTIAETPLKADPRELILEFPSPRRVRRIRIVNENLYRFSIAYWDLERGEWRTLKTVWQRRDVEGRVRSIQPRFDFTRINFETNKIRITTTRTVQDVLINKMAPDPGDKILDRIRKVVAGTWLEYYRVIVESPARVREVEVYGVLRQN